MVITPKKIRSVATTLFTYALVLIWIFPIYYMVTTSFKVEESVIPPSLIIEKFTLNNYEIVLNARILSHINNSLVITVISVLLCVAIGVPAAYRIVFGRMKNPDNMYFWFVSTQLLPPAAVLIPAFLALRNLGLLDTQTGLILLYVGIHTPLIIWMVTSFFKDVPLEILEAASIDGCTKTYAFFRLVVPLTKAGIMSASLLTFVFIWNEFFFAVNLTAIEANTLPVYMASFMTQEGLFWAKLSAISTVSIALPVVLGIISQKYLVEGLTMGSVKG